MHNPNDTSISDLDDLGEQFDSTVDILDQLFENIDIALNEASHPENKKDSFALLDTDGNERSDISHAKVCFLCVSSTYKFIFLGKTIS